MGHKIIKVYYNCYGKTRIQTWEDSKKLVFEKYNQSTYIKRKSDTLNLNDNYKL
ncbi:protein of unknown function [Cardinium endosymbiont cEper1 of Encarsia pergandiella]|nr:protein of unknown function [Cardinium endosymbiont cEper1 of Encarsia pergandiella]